MPTDAERKEILKLLYLLKEYAERRGGEEGSPTRAAYINRYISEYSKRDPNVKQSNFIDLHDPKEEASDPKNTVRVYMRSKFLQFMNVFFESEGRQLRYHLTFPPDKGYSLILKENPFWSETSESIGTRSVSYTEHVYFKTRYRPILFYIVSILAFLGGAGLFLKGTAMTLAGRGHFFLLLGGCIFLVMSMILFSLTKSLAKVNTDKFAYFIWQVFFFKRFNELLMLASYKSSCPVCRGKVVLTYTKKKDIGYIARCQNHPEGHTFSFDHVILTGKQLSP